MAEKDYAEELFDAMSILIQKKAESIKFDETINATIIDASKSKDGIYTVSTGNAKFIAYSTETGYKENDAVMVTIPQGNYDNQKIIIGKQVNDLNTPMIYKTPFQSIIDISGNLIKSGNNEISYWANSRDLDEGRPWDISEQNFENSELNPIWENDTILSLQGYTRLGLRAQFSTWLSEYETISGNYGLVLEIRFKNPKDEANPWSKFIPFDSSEFFGDIYNFQSYYTQEQVFDISEYKNFTISGLRLYAYQRNNFRDIYGNEIPTKEDFTTIGPNIFIKDPYICVGIASEEFTGDSAELYCEQDLTYYKELDGKTEQDRTVENKKAVFLRWIHKDETSGIIKTVDYDDEYFLSDYEIRWYMYQLGAQSPDEFAGAHWVRYYGMRNAVDPETGNWAIDSEAGLDIVTNKLQAWFQPNVNNQTERLKVIILKKIIPDTNFVTFNTRSIAVTSNILEFTNKNEVRNQQTFFDMSDLRIEYQDDEQGHYFLYDEAGDIVKNEDKEVRTLQALFKNSPLNVNDCSSIKWTFIIDSDSDPNSDINEIRKKSTMIIPMQSPSKDSPVLSGYTKTNVSSVGFTIKPFLDHSATNNTIKLEIIKDGQKYSAQVQPIFGTAGTNGSDYTIVLNWLDNKNAFDIDKTEEQLKGEIFLYDSAGDMVDFPPGTTVKCDWSVAEYGNGTVKEKEVETSDYYYPILNSNTALQFSGSDTDSPYQQGDYYYLPSISGAETYTYDISTKHFIRSSNTNEILYRKRTTGEIKYKLEFRQITLAEEPLNQSTGNYNYNHENNNIVIGTSGRKYYYSQKRRYFVKIDDQFVLDPWDNYQETETYYEPILAKEKNYIVTKNADGTTAEAGSLIATVEKGSNDKSFIVTIKKNGSVSIDSLYILQITVDNFGDYPLVSNFPIPLKHRATNDFLIDYIDGPTRVRYDSDGQLHYNKNPYRIVVRKKENNVYEAYTNYSENEENALPGSWKIFFPNTQHYRNEVDNFKPSLAEENGTYILKPLSVYIPDAIPYGVQFYSTEKREVIWTQPILVYENRYPSRTLNKWDGKGIETDNEAGTIVASGFAAGKKERDNSFTGVVIGDWSRSPTSVAVAKNTGVYGFNYGAMAYALKDDGTAFFGKDGHGRIYFDGNKSQIYSSDWLLGDQGMLLDIDNGYIKMHRETGQFNDIDTSSTSSHTNSSSGDKYITMGVVDSTWPLSIGISKDLGQRNFRVRWDGSLYATNGSFSGYISSSSGQIGGWIIDGDKLYAQNNTIYFDSTEGVIHGVEVQALTGEIGGWIISSDRIKSPDGNTELRSWANNAGNNLPNIITKYIAITGITPGLIGNIEGSSAIYDTSSGEPIGIADTNAFGMLGQGTIIIRAKNSGNLGLRAEGDVYINAGYTGTDTVGEAGNNYIYISQADGVKIKSSKITFDSIPANQQYGIYARFA